jgi:protein-disulfide isomerase-like protein with CxxC motif
MMVLLVIKLMRMMKMQLVENKLAYMDSLSRANGSGHKVDNELKEVIQSLRQDLGIEDEKVRFVTEVKKEARAEVQSIALRYIQKLQEDEILTFKLAEKAREEIWKIPRD